MVCASFKGHYAALISDSSTPARSFKTTNTGTIALRGVPALLYCTVTEATGCEKLD